jgi:hypothetical protein
MEVRVKNEFLVSTYIKSFFQRSVHYVVITSFDLWQDRRRVLNIEDLTEESQKLIRNSFKSESLDKYM